MDSLGLTWTHLDSLGLTWTHLVSLGLTWTHLDSLGLTWTHLDSPGLTRSHKGKGKTSLGQKGKGKARNREFHLILTRRPDRAHARTHARHDTKRFPGWTHPPPTSDSCLYVCFEELTLLTFRQSSIPEPWAIPKSSAMGILSLTHMCKTESLFLNKVRVD